MRRLIAPARIARCGACALFFSLFFTVTQAADEVVVTATRFPERALDAPIGMRVISASDIAASTARDLPEVLGTLGGAHVRSNTGSPDLQIDLRGFGITGDDNTLILLDGVRIEKPDLATRALSGIPLEVIERIEILPGSGAVLYGSGTSGGTINVITRNPGAGARRLSITAGAGSFDAREYSGNFFAGEENLGLVLSAKHYESDNYRDNNDIRQSSAIGKLRWQKGDARASLSFGGQSQDLGLPSERTEAQMHGDRNGTKSPDDRSDIETWFTTLNTGVRTGPVEWESDFSYRRGQNNAKFVSFGSDYDARYDTTIVSPRMRWAIPATSWMKSSLVAGVEWVRTDWSAESAGGFPSAGDAQQDSKAAYAMWFADFSSGTRFNYGLRMQHLRNERRDTPPSAPAEEEDHDRLRAYEIGLRQDLGEFFSVHIKRERSYRIANADENYGRIATANLLKPQVAKEWEAGIEFQTEGLRLSLVAFDIELDNEIAYSPLLFSNVNLEPTRRRGVEFGGRWQVAKNFSIGGNLSRLRATFRDGPLDGNDVPLVPEWLANVYANWEPVPGRSISANYTYVGKQRYDNDQANTFPERMPGYGVFGMRVTQELGDWLLTAKVDNVFDKDYYTYGIANSFGCPTFCGYPQPGRTFFASVSYRFE